MISVGYLCLDLGTPALLYIVQERQGVLVGYRVEILVGLRVTSSSRITWTRSSSLFSVGNPMGPVSTGEMDSRSLIC